MSWRDHLEDGWIGRLRARLTNLRRSPPPPMVRARELLTEGRPAEAARLLAPLAHAGEAEAQVELGRLYERGRGVVRNLADAAMWFERAAAQDHVEGLTRLAALLMGAAAGAEGDGATPSALFPNGMGVDRAPERARELVTRAARSGNVEALALAGYMNAAGIGGPVDMAAALAFYRPAAEGGSIEAALGYGTMLAGGHMGTRDPVAARPWFAKAAAAGNVTASVSLAIDLLQGLGGPPDLSRAADLLKGAAATGNGAALRLLGLLHLQGAGVARDQDQAEKLLKAAVARGDVDAHVALGDLWRESRPPEALASYVRAAERGHRGAMRVAADMLRKGAGVPKNPAEAARWLRGAAEAGDRDAQFDLGVAYAVGDGVGCDLGEAAVWSRKAAEAGHPTAKVNIGRFMMQGAGVSRDPANALVWLRSAIDDGELAAIVALGELFAFWADPPDTARARALFEHAVRIGDVRAEELLERLNRSQGRESA